MNQPLVSIIIPTYNGAKTLTRAIESALKQEYSNKEIVIINDASTDETENILERYQKKYPDIIRYKTNEQNLKVTKTLVKLIEMSHGKYIAHLDDDDYYTDPHKTREQVELLEKHPEAKLATSWCELLFPDGTTKIRRTPEKDDDIKKRMYAGTNPIVHSTTMFRLEDALAVKNYDPTFQTTQDLDLWLRLGALGNIMTLPKNTLVYEVKGTSISGKKRFRQARDVIRALHKNRKSYQKYSHFYPITITKIIARQVIASLFPRKLIMQIKYRLS